MNCLLWRRCVFLRARRRAAVCTDLPSLSGDLVIGSLLVLDIGIQSFLSPALVHNRPLQDRLDDPEQGS